MSLIDKISDLAIAIANDIKGLNTKVNGFNGRLSATEGDVSGINDRVTVLEGLHEGGGGGDGLTIEQIDKYISSKYGLKPWEYSGEGWAKHPLTGTVYCKGVPEGETHKFDGDPIEYVSVYTKEDAKNYGARAATSNMTDMSGMFDGYNSFNEDISHWDVSNVTTMLKAFSNASAFNQDLSTWNTSKVTNMTYMFNNAYAFNQDISNWDVSNVTNMSGMFTAATSFNGNISEWDTSNVTEMSNMFTAATSFNGNISEWDTSNVTGMGSMFRDATSFNQDLSEWCVSKISNPPFRFNYNTPNWTLPKPVWGTCPRGEDGA